MNLYVFDGTALVYRAFYALPPLTNKEGKPTNAVLGVTRMLAKFVKERMSEGDSVIFVMDSKEPSFRHDLFEDYKANRTAPPDEMIAQLPYVDRLIEALSMPLLKGPGYEADDVIATIVEKHSSEFDKVFVVTGDKDLLQLVGGNVKVLRFASMGVSDLAEYGVEEVVGKYGLEPSQIGDYLALVGDSSDNVPGVKGIGDKTAVALLQKYGTLERIYAGIGELTKRQAKLLEDGREMADLSKRLVTLLKDVPISFVAEPYGKPNASKLSGLFDELDFTALKKEFELYSDVGSREARYTTVESVEDLEEMAKKLSEKGKFAFDTETTSLDTITAELVGLSFADGEAGYYVPVGHAEGTNLPLEAVIERIRPLLEGEGMKVIGQNLKYDIEIMMNYGVAVRPYFDTMIAAYLLNPNEKKLSLDTLALKYLNYKTVSYEEVAGKNGKFADVSVKDATRYSAEDADITYRLYEILNKKMYEYDMTELLEKMEMPVVGVLAGMERNGVYVDSAFLSGISEDYSRKIREIENEIYDQAGGMPFNLNSPKQVGEVLFGRLGLKPGKKTSTKSYSTSAEVLEEMRASHPIIPLLLDYRKYFKLKSTYIDALPKMINPKTSRIHTSFNQTGTSTGRLSSSEPNLQNLPARNEEGKEIRKAIRAQKEGWVILSADYSQIELRVLAHISEDEGLMKAFMNDVDIHTVTTSKIYGVEEGEVTDEMRRVGKMVNFAITYGVSAYGLAKRLGINQSDAGEVITNYFRNYPLVREYLENTVSEAKKKGYVETIFGRRREIPELKSRNRNIVEFGKRMAINAPIQGSAADIMKKAMIDIQKRLAGHRAAMILQVHDELVFELPRDEIESLTELVRDSMEGIVKLRIPLKVDVEVGDTW